ncbi:DUF7344 domain-containing protein [Natrinema amylolyticum]|uniref:DUF7344 domain-containing protein n=1 Tax=Natrinema amylolyticum TaxID=2878679 RepID=UPI001CFAB9ED|nr:hypothetical protein [Natrinema amylolyticum]
MNQIEAFRILASADRQLVLQELLEQDEVASVEEISQQVAIRRHQVSPEKISDTHVERAHVRLVHTHFPMLQEKGVIDVNWDENSISLIDDGDVIQLFDAAEELEGWPPDDLPKQPSD